MPHAHSVSCHEGALFRVRVVATLFETVDGHLGCFTEESVSVVSGNLHPIFSGNPEVFGMVMFHAIPCGMFDAAHSSRKSDDVELKQRGRRRVGWRRAASSAATAHRRRRYFAVECAQRIHRFKILTFRHFVLVVFNHAHKRSQIRIHGHSAVSVVVVVCLIAVCRIL